MVVSDLLYLVGIAANDVLITALAMFVLFAVVVSARDGLARRST